MSLFKKVTNLVTDTVGTAINTVESAGTNVLETGESLLTGDLKGAGKNLVETVTEPLSEIVNGGATFTENISGIAEGLGVPSTITNTVEAAMKTPINMTDAVVRNTEEAGKSLLDGDIEGVVTNVVEGFTEPLHEGVVGAATTADAAGTDLGTVGTAIGAAASTFYTGDPTYGAMIGRKVGDLADKYVNEGEITPDDAGRFAAGAVGGYVGGFQGAEIVDKIYAVGSDGHLSADDLIKSGKEVADFQEYYQDIPDPNYRELVSIEAPSVSPPISNLSPESGPDDSNYNESQFVSELPVQDESILSQGPKNNREYGNFESLKNELGLGNMPTISENSYTISDDINGDGKTDYVYDRDNRSIPYHIAEDTNGDGKIDYVYNRYDTNGDGYYETVVEAFDENGDGNFDYAYKSYDTNGDGHHDTVDYAYGNQSDNSTDQIMLSNDNNNVCHDPNNYIVNNDINYDFDDPMVNNDEGFSNI